MMCSLAPWPLRAVFMHNQAKAHSPRIQRARNERKPRPYKTPDLLSLSIKSTHAETIWWTVNEAGFQTGPSCEECNCAVLAPKGAAAAMSEHAGSHLQVQTDISGWQEEVADVQRWQTEQMCWVPRFKPSKNLKTCTRDTSRRTSLRSLNNLGRLVRCCGFIIHKKWFSDTQLWIERERKNKQTCWGGFMSWKTRAAHTLGSPHQPLVRTLYLCTRF